MIKYFSGIDFRSLALMLLIPFSIYSQAADQGAESEDIDHFLIGISNLEAGIAELESLTGVKAVYGGVHPSIGTHNALISLGPGRYLEVLAPNQENQLIPELEFLKELGRLTPVGLAISTNNIEGSAKNYSVRGVEVGSLASGARLRQDGKRLTWRTANLETPKNLGLVFLIQWSGDSIHPSEDSPKGCLLAGLEIEGAEELINALLPNVGVKATKNTGKSFGYKITLSCGGQEVSVPARSAQR